MYYNLDKDDGFEGYDRNELIDSGVVKFVHDNYTEALSFESAFTEEDRTKDLYTFED